MDLGQFGLTGHDISKLERGTFSLKLTTIAKSAWPFGRQAWELLRFAERLHETVETRHDDEPRLRTKNWRDT